MRMPRVRFTVRRLMIAVAVIAVALGVGLEAARLKRNCDRFESKANEHASWEVHVPGLRKKAAEWRR